MEEYFYILEGEVEFIADGVKNICRSGDFIFIEFLSHHELRALTNVKLLTIGAEVKS